ncbi:hypothetical protein MP638_007215 [Amoeboaphelidium occidentale]|nr:hypothetical protein MP638_007215 [Amoeboaphelidium occidentale]
MEDKKERMRRLIAEKRALQQQEKKKKKNDDDDDESLTESLVVQVKVKEDIQPQQLPVKKKTMFTLNNSKNNLLKNKKLHSTTFTSNSSSLEDSKDLTEEMEKQRKKRRIEEVLGQETSTSTSVLTKDSSGFPQTPIEEVLGQETSTSTSVLTKDSSGVDSLDEFMRNLQKNESSFGGGGGNNKGDIDSDSDSDDDDDDLKGDVKDESSTNHNNNLVEVLPPTTTSITTTKTSSYSYSNNPQQYPYPNFRKNFYIESQEIQKMSDEQVGLFREENDQIHVSGRKCPKPVMKWSQCGLPLQCFLLLKEQFKFIRPTAIQCQAIPCILEGRDLIGVAKTGSGKTLAFLLPMFRHIKDQPLVQNGEGPIGVVLAPTRELALQIYAEAKKFCRVLGFRVNCAYGGAPLQQQISETKRGCEIMISTPGRLIDLLQANSGRVVNLLRCTFLVLDEADRMFDLGFEQQVMKIVQMVRPNAQKVLFSATFPREMEALARKILKNPLEIIVGKRSVVADTIEQNVMLLSNEDEKFTQLLRVLGVWYSPERDQRTLVFVDRQESADNLLRELLRRGYPCCSLHGGKEQTDRDSTLTNFKSGVFQIMIATSVAARGLDVKECNLVINFDCPNHMEDYVHRVGRTGRAGRKGVAYTFITPDQEKYTPDIVKAMKKSKAEVPESLKLMADLFMEKVKRGEAVKPGSGFRGKGLEQIEKERDEIKKAQKLTFGSAEDQEDADDGETGVEGDEIVFKNPQSQQPSTQTISDVSDARKLALLSNAELVNRQAMTVLDAAGMRSERGDEDIVEKLNLQLRDSEHSTVFGDVGNFTAELEINDYPMQIRQKLLSKEFHDYLQSGTGCTVVVRGQFYEGKVPTGERKLHMIIMGETRTGVSAAKAEVVRAAKDVAKENGLLGPQRGPQARYTVV